LIALPGVKSLLSTWLAKPIRRAVLFFGLAALILLTVLAALPVNVIGPFDARTGEVARDVKVDYSPMGAALEPVTALAHVIAEAPDMRAAVISVPIWIVGLAVCGVAVSQLRRNRWRLSWRATTHTLRAAGVAIFLMAVYGMFALLVRIPNWRASSPDPDIVLAELHTHTFGSHDGLISARDCLQWHAQRGCGVVGVVEHAKPAGSLAAAALSESDESLPPVLPGLEINLKGEGYVSAIATREKLSPYPHAGEERPFIPWFHHNCEGVVLSLTYFLKPGSAEELAHEGLDGFDAVNDGHPGILPSLKKEAVAAANTYHLPLVASTDWHGASGILRTWTAVRVPHAATLSRGQRAAGVLDALRRHERSNITPVVVGRMKEVSLARAILAPFAEGVRYALSLSLARVLAWWAWAAALFLAAAVLMRLGIHPGRMILAGILVAMGDAILLQGLRLIIAHTSGEAPCPLPVGVGLAAAAMGTAAILFGAISGWLAVARRQFFDLDWLRT
jgi:predicted metal-dependent phosphoesterase TrpH